MLCNQKPKTSEGHHLVAKKLLKKKIKENTNLPKIKTSIAQDIQESLISNLLFPHFLGNQTKQKFTHTHTHTKLNTRWNSRF